MEAQALQQKGATAADTYLIHVQQHKLQLDTGKRQLAQRLATCPDTSLSGRHDVLQSQSEWQRSHRRLPAASSQV